MPENNIRDNLGINNFKETFREVVGDAIRKPVSVALGYVDDNGVQYLKVPAEDSDQPNKYYFHELGGQPFQGQAFLIDGVLAKKEIRFNMPVRIEKDALNGAWTIKGRDPLYGAEFLGDVEDPPVVVDSSQIIIGLLTETVPPSMKARVLAGAYSYGSVYKYFDTQLTIDFTSEVPTTNGKAKYGLVSISFETGELAYSYGVEISSAPNFAQVAAIDAGAGTLLPQPAEGYFRSGYVKLVAGMTRVNKATNIWAVQEFLFKSPGALPEDILPLIVTACGEVLVDDNGDVIWE